MPDEIALTALHPDHIKALRVTAVINAAPFVIAAGIGEYFAVLPHGAIAVPLMVLAAAFIWLMPRRRWRRKGYAMGADRLRVVRGWLFRSDTVVPFNRVQHIDVHEGPIQRYYSLATLTLHTAGTHGAAVALDGLHRDDALAMREAIRDRIRAEER